MKKLAISLLFILMALSLQAQEVQTSIHISQPSGLKYANTRSILVNTLTQASALNSLSASEYSDAPYSLDSEVMTLNVITTPGAPTKYVVELEVRISMVFQAEKKTLSECSFRVRGIGSSESRAYTQAIRRINPRSSELKRMLEFGRAAL